MLSFKVCNFGPESSHTMPRKATFSRLPVIPVCILLGVHELFALQRSRLQVRGSRYLPRFHS